jgi:hypothetical protein
MSDLATLATRRRRLLVLQVNVDQELAAIESAMRVWVRRPGRPRKPYTMTSDEARVMHGRYNRGERGPDVRLGEREYKRRSARARRMRGKP